MFKVVFLSTGDTTDSFRVEWKLPELRERLMILVIVAIKIIKSLQRHFLPCRQTKCPMVKISVIVMIIIWRNRSCNANHLAYSYTFLRRVVCRLSVCRLSHSCIMFKLFDGFRSQLPGTHVRYSDTLCYIGYP